MLHSVDSLLAALDSFVPVVMFDFLFVRQQHGRQTSATKTVQQFDKTACADAVTDKPPMQSVLHKSTGTKECTLEDLREIEQIKRNNPGQKEAKLKSKKRPQNLQDLIFCDDNHPLAKQLSTKLAHKQVTKGKVEIRHMVCQEDDPMILRATNCKTFLLQLPHLTNFYLQWSSFYDRNEAEFDEAIAGTEFQQCATAVDT